jgi:hypothetical protein
MGSVLAGQEGATLYQTTAQGSRMEPEKGLAFRIVLRLCFLLGKLTCVDYGFFCPQTRSLSLLGVNVKNGHGISELHRIKSCSLEKLNKGPVARDSKGQHSPQGMKDLEQNVGG